MPVSVNRPPVMSPTDVPAFIGGPPGWPVTLMRPPSACTIMSYAGLLTPRAGVAEADTAA